MSSEQWVNAKKSSESSLHKSDTEGQGDDGLVRVTTCEVQIVDWDGHNDEEDVQQISKFRKIIVVIILTFASVCQTCDSSAWSVEVDLLQQRFNKSRVVVELGVSMFTLAVAFGALIGGPLSEYVGRKPVFMVSMTCYTAVHFMVAFGQNLETMIIGRALSGGFGSIFLANAPATFGDLFQNPRELGFFLNIVNTGIYFGPLLGPLFSSIAYLAEDKRWIWFMFIIWGGICLILIICFVPETYPPKLKTKKAQRMRKETGHEFYRSKMEMENKSVASSLARVLKRPIVIFFTEPIVTALCVYCSFLMTLNYFFSGALPEVFTSVYGFNIQQGGLTFLSLVLGMVAAGAYEGFKQLRYGEKLAMATPEDRLVPMMWGSVLLPIGLFMFAWTIYPSVHWIVPLIGCFLFGLGSYTVFNAIISFLVRGYKQFSASVLAANVFTRCLISVCGPLVTGPLLHNLGSFHWGLSLLGFLAAFLAPLSFILWKFGPKLRAKSKLATN